MVGEIVGEFKSITSHGSLQGVHTQGWLPFNKSLWQCNDYEHIVRSQTNLEKKVNYATTNPVMWVQDGENSAQSTQQSVKYAH